MVIRPACFQSNPETADSNAFQQAPKCPSDELQNQALTEWGRLVDLLVRAGLEAIAFDDTPDPVKPDAMFPNNLPIRFRERLK